MAAMPSWLQRRHDAPGLPKAGRVLVSWEVQIPLFPAFPSRSSLILFAGLSHCTTTLRYPVLLLPLSPLRDLRALRGSTPEQAARSRKAGSRTKKLKNPFDR